MAAINDVHETLRPVLRLFPAVPYISLMTCFTDNYSTMSETPMMIQYKIKHQHSTHFILSIG